MQHCLLCQNLIVPLTGCALVFCRKNSRLHQKTGLTISMCNVIFCSNRGDKIGIEKSVAQGSVLKLRYWHGYQYRMFLNDTQCDDRFILKKAMLRAFRVTVSKDIH